MQVEQGVRIPLSSTGRCAERQFIRSPWQNSCPWDVPLGSGWVRPTGEAASGQTEAPELAGERPTVLLTWAPANQMRLEKMAPVSWGSEEGGSVSQLIKGREDWGTSHAAQPRQARPYYCRSVESHVGFSPV